LFLVFPPLPPMTLALVPTGGPVTAVICRSRARSWSGAATNASAPVVALAMPGAAVLVGTVVAVAGRERRRRRLAAAEPVQAAAERCRCL